MAELQLVRQTTRGQSVAGSTIGKQDYGTPREFLDAVERRFGKIAVDLAAYDDGSNAVAPNWIGGERDSLKQAWCRDRRNLLWLNPPFKHIDPWAKKCAEESKLGARILLLTPASIDSVWYAEHVLPNAYVMAVRPRITFVGEENAYPKPLMLSLFDCGVRGFEQWKWR